MKKIALLLILAMLFGCLTACGSAETEAPAASESEAEETDAAELVGGWTVQDAAVCTISETAQAAFDKALENWTGTGMKAIAMLGTQVVAGTNYCFLAEVTPVVPNPVSHYSLVYIYADLDGNAEITNTADIDMTCDSYSEDAENTDGMVGAWTVADVEGADIGDAQAAFDKAFEAYTGAAITPAALLGTQVVSGCNYLVLGTCKIITAQPYTKVVLVKLYQDLQGGAEVLGIYDLDIVALSSAE